MTLDERIFFSWHHKTFAWHHKIWKSAIAVTISCYPKRAKMCHLYWTCTKRGKMCYLNRASQKCPNMLIICTYGAFPKMTKNCKLYDAICMMPTPKMVKYAIYIVPTWLGLNMPFIWCLSQKKLNMPFIWCLPQKSLNLSFIHN